MDRVEALWPKRDSVNLSLHRGRKGVASPSLSGPLTSLYTLPMPGLPSTIKPEQQGVGKPFISLSLTLSAHTRLSPSPPPSQLWTTSLQMKNLNLQQSKLYSFKLTSLPAHLYSYSPTHSSAQATLATMSDLSNPFVMLTYYRRCFPFKDLFLWLNHGQGEISLCSSSRRARAHLATRLPPSPVPTRQFTHREFAMNLPNDVYIRYCSYANAEEMKKDVVRLNPARFEIGPVYSARVSRRLHGHFARLE